MPADAADKAKVKACAEELLQQAKQNRASLPNWPGSIRGTRLGGKMAAISVLSAAGDGQPFDAAMFAMQKGEIRGGGNPVWFSYSCCWTISRPRALTTSGRESNLAAQSESDAANAG